MKVTEFKCEVRFDLRGCFEATMASEATKMADIVNMHINVKSN